ncbi:unnamed protein product [Brassica rapa]|uniref:Uncharacterized protein n=1 Tax=Brassica campestris TaxID=3711 RepID=A0A8D9G581_BRACM|nr:unnamed protein product [Brassica rapa]
MLKLHGCRKLKLKLKDDNHSLAVSYTSSSTQVPKLRTVPVIEEGPREQRNQLFSVLGSLTDPEEEESKDSSEFSKRVLPHSEMVMVLETFPGNLLELDEMEGLEELVLEVGHALEAVKLVVQKVMPVGERPVQAVVRRLELAQAGFVVVVEASCWADNWCNLWSCGGETVGVTSGGGVVGDAGGGVAETGGTTVVGVVA